MVSLFFSFYGRISRAQYWLGGSLLGIVSAAVIGVLAMSMGLSIYEAPSAEAVTAALRDALLLIAPLMLVTGYCAYALQVKRLHDRGRTGFIALAPLVVGGAMLLQVIGGLAEGAPMIKIMAATQPYTAVLWLINLLFFIDLGCLPGVDGPNRYGDPPGSPRTPSPERPSSLVSAETAMERAIAERRTRQPRPANPASIPMPAPMPAPANPSGGASFGRRPTR